MENKTIDPPSYLDGAKVIKWAWSGQLPFGYMGNKDDQERVEIYGLAICKYDNSDSIYRFSCDKDWEVINDSPQDSIEDAAKNIPNQYKNVEITWQSK